MGAILTGPDIASDKARLSFLPYQREWIKSTDRKTLCEKAVRVGWTYCDAFKQIRRRISSTEKRDYLFVTKDQPTAYEYIEHCMVFLRMYNLASSIIMHGTEEVEVPIFNEDGKDTGFAEKITVAMIKLDTGSRIMAFSSNPNAVRAYGGDVGWDEAAFHPRGLAMWASLQGRARWGYDLGVWSSHNGDDTVFEILCEKARKGEDDWVHYKCDVHKAIEQGLVEKINEVRGTNITREQYLQQCKSDALMPEIFEQEYELKPVGGLASIVPWSVIASARSEYDIDRAHFSQDMVEKLFGEPGANDGRRKALVEKHLLAVMPELFKTDGSNRWRVGFDVAASRQGHLGAMWVSEKIGDSLKLRALVTTQTEDWDVIEWLLETIFSKIPGEVYGSGDETGLGRQICWRMAKLFHGRFFPVNFSSKKSDMGTDLMGRLSSGEIEIPKEHPDIAQDIFAIRKGYKGSKAVFTESRNPANDQSHADMAWACALACDADSQAVSEYWAIVA